MGGESIESPYYSFLIIYFLFYMNPSATLVPLPTVSYKRS